MPAALLWIILGGGGLQLINTIEELNTGMDISMMSLAFLVIMAGVAMICAGLE